MWTLDKPLLKDAIADIAKVIAASKGKLSKSDGVIMNYLYREYDKNNGVITTADDDKLCDAQKKALYYLYESQTYEGQDLYYIREELFKLAKVCPMCGFGEISQLDHQMPRADYKSLSVCRLNLVPTCGVCNNKKRKNDSTTFIHPYYDHAIKDVPFFIIEVNSTPDTHKVYWNFGINEALIGNQLLIDKINNQIGIIKLYKRLMNETNEMLSDMLSGMDDWSQESLDETLEREYRKHYRRRGINDWHTVFVKGLIESPNFTIVEAKEYARNNNLT